MSESQSEINMTVEVTGMFYSSDADGDGPISVSHGDMPDESTIYIQQGAGEPAIEIHIDDVGKFASFLNRYVKKVKEELE